MMQEWQEQKSHQEAPSVEDPIIDSDVEEALACFELDPTDDLEFEEETNVN